MNNIISKVLPIFALLASVFYSGCTATINPNSLSEKDLEKELYKELFSLKPTALPETNHVIGAYSYSAHMRTGLRLPIISRSKISGFEDQELNKTESPPTLLNVEVLLDLNNITMQFPYAEFGGLRFRDDGTALAFTIRLTPSENYTLFEKTFSDSQTITVSENAFDFEYSGDGKLYFTAFDSKDRPSSVFIYRDALTEEIYKENDEKFHLSLSRSKDGTALFINKDNLSERSVLIVNRDLVKQISPTNGWNKIIASKERYFLIQEDLGKRSLLTTDRKLDRLESENFNWRKLEIRGRDGTYYEIHDIEPFQDFLVFTSRIATKPILIFMDHSFNELTKFELSTPYYDIKKRLNGDENSKKYLFETSSPIDLPRLYEFNISERTFKIISESTLTRFNSKDFELKQIEGTSKDKKKVFTTYFRNIKEASLEKPHPTLLIGYGSYGLNPPAAFDETLIPLLNRGVVIAICHVRGGGEVNAEWRNLGIMSGKINSVNDLISCRESLIKNRISDSARIAAQGKSAGGTLVASAIVQNPDLFKVAILKMPFLNVRETLSNPDLPLAIRDQSEWGDPKNPEAVNYLKIYSPYESIKSLSTGEKLPAKKFPSTLIVSGGADKLVPVKDAAQWLEKIRATNPEVRLYHRTLEGVDHHGPNDWAESRRETAFEYAFLLKEMVK